MADVWTGVSSRGDMLNASMNQVFGAVNAKTSVLGVSDMFANLLIADNGATQRRGVHLIEDLWGVNQIPLRPKAWRGDAQSQETLTKATSQLGAMPLGINQSDARGALNLLSGTLLAGTGLGGGNGTAFTACNQAIGSCALDTGVWSWQNRHTRFNYPTAKTVAALYPQCHRQYGGKSVTMGHSRRQKLSHRWHVMPSL